MKKLGICFTFYFLTLFCVVNAFGQAVAPQTAAKPTPPESLIKVISTQTPEEDQYKIGTQDILDVQVFKHPELNQRIAVGPLGTIALFKLEKPVTAVCKTARELANDIEIAYKEKYLRDPDIQVMVLEQKSRSFAVIGAVEKPGNYFISRRVHLLELLAFAGGPNKESGTRVLVARAGSNSNCKENSASAGDDEGIEVMDFKLRDVQEGKQTLWMKAGDVVSVLDADIVYVYGNVNKQGSLKIREPITLTQAIASAEGLKPAAKTSKIRVLRQTQGKADREEIIYDLGLIDKGKMKDPYLEPNDIVAVSEDKAKAILRGITNTIKNTVPSAAYRF
ncbi:MAG: SLBB domain-containing protein [Chloracidobacterium sp.]|nr:SLBB domain-containing protein [Chloracidobacterium sp.]